MTKEQFLNLKQAADSPLWFVENVVGAKPELYQAEVLKAIGTEDRVAWRSGHGVGKTACAAWAVLWFFFTHPSSKIITTATSWRQVIRQLWPEIHLWRKRANLEMIGLDHNAYEYMNLMLRMDDDWFATGEASDVPEKMEGFHADYLFFVIDEGKSVPDKTYESIEGALATPNAKQLIISTPPPQMAGYFYDVFTSKRKNYKTFHTSAVDSPRVSQDWVNDRRLEWGKDSPIYQTRVLGEFAESSDDTLIPLKWVEQAVGRKLETEGDKVLGVDVARFGDNKTVFALRRGAILDNLLSTGKEDTMQTAGRVRNFIKGQKPDKVKIDVVGVGGGVVDRLIELGEAVDGVNVGEKAGDKERFVNLRAEIFWGLRERFREGDISIPDDEELIGQLSNIKYKFDSRGRTKIESKEEMQKRGLKSPDKADAVALAFSGVTGIRPMLYIPE